MDNKGHTFIFFTLVLLGCEIHDSKNGFIQKAPEPISIDLQSIPIFSANKQPVSIAAVDTFLIVRRMNEPIFLVFSTNSHEQIHAFGKLGDGPDEFGGPVFFPYPDGDNSERPVFGIYDFNKNRVTYTDIRNALSSDTTLTIYEHHVVSMGGFANRFYLDSEDYTMAMVEFPANQAPFPNFNILDKRTGTTWRMPPAPYHEYGITPTEVIPERILSYSWPAYNSVTKTIAVAACYLPRIDFLDSNLDIKYSLIYDDPIRNKQKIEGPFIQDGIRPHYEMFQGEGYLQSMFFTDQYLFLIHDKVPKAFIENDFDVIDKYIRVVDWDGNQKAILNFQVGVQTSISYNKTHHRLYFYDPAEDEFNLLFTDLPKF